MTAKSKKGVPCYQRRPCGVFKGGCLWFFVLFLWGGTGSTAWAAPCVSADHLNHSLVGTGTVRILIDSKRALTQATLPPAGDSTWFALDRLNFGYGRRAVWVRGCIDVQRPHEDPLVLEIAYPLLDEVEGWITSPSIELP